MSTHTFEVLGLPERLVKALERDGIVEPTPVQARAIPLLLEGRDLIASAPTGTGKTAAFLLPALTRIGATEPPRGRGPRVLVLTPTRELAQQVAKAARSFTALTPRTTTVCVTGGESYFLQNKLLAAPHEILVATPGRLMDQMRSGKIDLSRVEVLVLDEADRMLDMGFSDDVLAIAGQTPDGRQTVCFTATLSAGVRSLAGQLLTDPHWMEVEKTTSNDEAIDQHVIYVDDLEHRNRLLTSFLGDEGLGQAIVFTSTKRHAEELAGWLHSTGHSAEALHGDLNQRDRTRALNKLRRGDCKVLVATDVAARGIDVSTITHVINFDLPKFAEDYVHRIGRTGRAGASGQALSFVGRDDVFALRKIERFIGRKVQVSEVEGLEARFRPAERGFGGKGRGGYGGRPGGGGGPRGRFGGGRPFESRGGEGRHGEPRQSEPRQFEPRTGGAPHQVDQRNIDPRGVEQRFGNQRGAGEQRFGNQRNGEQRFGAPRHGEQRQGEHRPGEQRFAQKRFGNDRAADGRRFGNDRGARDGAPFPRRADRAAD